MQSKPALPSLRSCSATLAVLLLGLGLASVPACGGVEDPDSIAVVVHMPQVPSDTAQLSVLASLNGTAAMSPLAITDATKFSRFGVRLSKDKSGTLALTIDLTDANACKLGTATASTAIGPPLQADVSATLTLLGTRQCPAPPQPMTCSPALFCWSNPLPQGNPIRGTFALSATDVWAVGDAGTVLHLSSGSWSLVASGVSADLYAVWASSPSDVFAVGEKGTVIHWNGTAFSAQTSGLNTSTTLRGVWGTSSGNVFAVGDGGNIIRYTGGTSWGAPNMLSAVTLNAVSGVDQNNIYAVGNTGTILYFNGSVWAPQTVNAPANAMNLFGVASVGGTSFAVGAGGTITKLNAGTWSNDTSPTTQQLSAIYGRSATDFWAVGLAGTRLHYTGTWADASGADGGMADLYAVSGAGTTVFAGGNAGAVLSTTGAAWSAAIKGGTGEIRSMYGFSPKDIWVVGASGMILHYDGQSWTPASSGTSENLNSVWGSSATDVWAVGDNHTLLHNQGSGWTSVTVQDPSVTNLNGVWGSGPLDVWAVGGCSVATENHILHIAGPSQAGVILNTSPGNAPTMYSVWGSSDKDIRVGGDHVIVTLVSNLGMPQLTGVQNVGNIVRSIWGSSGGDVWAVGDGGLVTHNAGAGWIATGGIPTSNDLAGVWGIGTNDLWVVGRLGTVLRYDGTTWTTPADVTKNKLNTVFGFNATDVWTAGASSTILHTLK